MPHSCRLFYVRLDGQRQGRREGERDKTEDKEAKSRVSSSSDTHQDRQGRQTPIKENYLEKTLFNHTANKCQRLSQNSTKSLQLHSDKTLTFYWSTYCYAKITQNEFACLLNRLNLSFMFDPRTSMIRHLINQSMSSQLTEN